MNGLSTPEAVAELRHELRTPLNLIIGYGEMLLEDAEAAGRRAMLERTLAAGRDLLSLINAAVPPSRGEISAEEFEALRDSLRNRTGASWPPRRNYSPRGRRAQTRSLIATCGG